MSTRLYLIRHGESTWNVERRYIGASDPPLSIQGRQQAERTAEALRGVSLHAVYASPLARALETAMFLARAHGLDVIPVADFREYSAGVWESLTLVEIEERYGELLQRWYADPSVVRIPGGETLEEMRSRVLPSLHGIVRAHPDEGIAVVAHGGVNRAVILTVLGVPLSSFWRIRQDNACINLLEFNGSHARVLIMNETTHLKLREQGNEGTREQETT